MIYRALVRSLLIMLVFTASFIWLPVSHAKDGQKVADTIASFTSRGIYNLDIDQLYAVLESFLFENDKVKGLLIEETIDNEVLLRYHKRDDQRVFDQEIPSNIKLLPSFKAQSYFDDEHIGNITIYYKDDLPLTAQERAWLKEHPVIRIGVDPAWPPFDFVENGQHQGLAYEYFQTLSKKLNISFEVVPGLSWSEVQEKAKAREVDLVSMSQETPERAKYLNYTSPVITTQWVVVTKTDHRDIQGLGDVRGEQVGIVKGYAITEIIKKQYPDMNIVEIPSTLEGLRMASTGQIDAVIDTLGVVGYLIAENSLVNLKIAGPTKLKSTPLAFGVRSDWPVFREILEKTLKTIPVDEVRKMREKWMSLASQTADLRARSNNLVKLLSDEELAFLAKHKKVRVRVGDWAPFHFVENGQPQGMALDHLKWMFDQLNVEMEIVPLSWNEALENIEKLQKIDILPTIAYSKERERHVLFTDDYLSYPMVIFNKQTDKFVSMEDLSGKKVAVERNFIMHKLLEQDFPNINLFVVESTQDALEAVSFGEADAYISNMAVGSYLIEKLGLSNMRVSGRTPYKHDLQHIGVRKDWPEMVSILNKTLYAMTDQTKRDIRHKWLEIESFDSKSNVKRLKLTPEEQKWVNEHPVLRVHNEMSWAPFNFNDDGKPKGFSIDYMDLLAEKIGFSIEYISGPRWSEFLAMIRNKALDVMLNIVKTPARDEYILFTEPYVDNPPMVVTQEGFDVKSFKDLAGRLVCVPEGFFYQEIFERDYPHISLLLAQNQSQCLKLVSSGMADATVGGLAVQDNLIKKLFLTNLRVVATVEDPMFSNNLRIGVRKDWPMLQSLLQKAINNTTSEEISSIRNRWIVEEAKINATYGSGVDTMNLVLIIGGTSIGLVLLLWGVRFAIAYMAKRDGSKGYESHEVKGTGILVVGVFLAVVILAAWVTAQKAEQDTRRSVGDQLQTVLNTTHEALRTWLRAETRYLERIANDPELLEYVKALLLVEPKASVLSQSQSLKSIRDWFAAHSKGREVQGFFIISPDKISIGSQRDNNLGTLNLISKFRDRRLEQAFQGETQFIPPIASDVRISGAIGIDFTQEPTMFLAAPIFDENKKVIAVLTLRYDPTEDFTRIAQLGQLGESGETYVFDRKAILVTDSRFDFELQKIGLLEKGINAILNLRVGDPGHNLLEHSKLPEDVRALPLTYMARSAIAGDQGVNVQGYRDYRGVTVLGAWLWDAKLDVGMTTEMDEAEAMSTFSTLSTTVLVILGITVVVALTLTGLSVWIGQSANKSLRRARDNLEIEVQDRTRELNFQKFALDKHAIVSSTDADGNIIYVNDRFIKVTGYSREEMMGQNHRFLKSGLHDRAFYEDMWATITSGKVWHGELCNQNKDGSHIWLAASIIPFTDEEGKPERYVSIRTDITERKLAEQKVRDSEGRIRAIIQNAVDGIIVINSKGIVQSFSPAAERIFGFTEDEVVGHNIKMLMPDNIAFQHDMFLSDYLSGHTRNVVDNNREVVGRHKDGTEFPMDLAVGESVIEGEHIFTGIVRDISSRKEAEQELQSSRNQLQDILSNVVQAVVMFDENKKLVAWNKHYPSTLNLNEELLVPGMDLYDIAFILASRGQYDEEGEPEEIAQKRVDFLWNGENRGDVSYGDDRIFDTHSIKTSDGRLVVTYTDITQRKKNEEIIAQSMKLIQESISYASRIQRSVLPTDQEFSNVFADFFLIWEPKDIVGGDICLLRETDQGALMTLVDCTGHGVPGAFMTMVVTGALDQALIELPRADPSILLSRMNQLVKGVLSQVDDKGASDDGFECGMCLIHNHQNTMQFAGARFELWACSGDEIEIIKGDKIGIGYRATPFDRAFDLHEVRSSADISYYMTSDGMIDQIGGERRRSFGKKRLKRAILDSLHRPMEDQEKNIYKVFHEYEAGEERRDDISCIGFKVKQGL
ncbi:transporter substrate-binding domain-containing protein [Terasakiella sp. SH-1]|uniref:transporter substrate-binding domain-containing protein n=1 Tax=Terasakiella sp. SH-1 TaxID=2560057 RepID=UPI0010734729|nr:transporter substrate-binding domain-containing protein [Terasakiella sp. SH-1]